MRIVGIGLALGMVLAGGGCRGAESVRDPSPIAVTVRTIGSSAGTAGGAYSANIQPYTQVSLVFQVSGYVQTVTQVKGAGGHPRDLQGGDPVIANQMLATVRPDTFQEQLNSAKSQLVGAQATLTQTKVTYDRNAELLKQRVVSQSQYDSALQQYQAAQSQVDALQAQLRQAQINLGYCTLRAPMDGVLLSRGIDVGSLVGPGTSAFQIADTREMKAVFGLPDSLVGQMKQGSALELRSAAMPDATFHGTITRIAPQADASTHVFDVEVTVPNADGKLRSGMVASLRLNGSDETAAPIVPLDAIVRPPGDNHGYAVYVLDEHGPKPVARMEKVQLGEIAGNDIAVISGLGLGQKVIVRGASMLSNGEAVQVIPASGDIE
jgi:multidrug efflux system membrane fusion protein